MRCLPGVDGRYARPRDRNPTSRSGVVSSPVPALARSCCASRRKASEAARLAPSARQGSPLAATLLAASAVRRIRMVLMSSSFVGTPRLIREYDFDATCPIGIGIWSTSMSDTWATSGGEPGLFGRYRPASGAERTRVARRADGRPAGGRAHGAPGARHPAAVVPFARRRPRRRPEHRGRLLRRT